MNKKLIMGWLGVFVLLSVLEALINVVVLAPDFEATAHLWRPAAEMKLWLFYVVYFFVSFFFTLIFSKGYEGNGMQEGMRYGALVGLMMAIPMAYGSYGAMPIPYSLALKWFFAGFIEYTLCGCLLGIIYGKTALVKKATS